MKRPWPALLSVRLGLPTLSGVQSAGAAPPAAVDALQLWTESRKVTFDQPVAGYAGDASAVLEDGNG